MHSSQIEGGIHMETIHTQKSKKYELWETLLRKEWDALCAVHLHGYLSFYAGHLNNHYSGVVLIVRDKYYPQVVHNDPYGRFLVRHTWSRLD